MKRMLLISMLAFLTAAGGAFADEPPLPPRTYTTYANGGRFYAVSDLERKVTTCYEVVDGAPTERWQIDGWHDFLWLSDGGEYCVILHSYNSMIGLDYKKDNVLFSVYKNGALYDRQRVRDVIRNTAHLQRTASHYHWGEILDVYDGGIFFDTVEGLKRYDFAQKSFATRNDAAALSAWTVDELAGHSLELLSQKDVESFSFTRSGSEARGTVSSVRGKKGGALTAPIEWWWITDDGLLRVTDTSFPKRGDTIGKIYLNKERGIVYALRGGKLVRYAYKPLEG